MVQQCSLCDSWWPENCQCAQIATDVILQHERKEAGPGALQQAQDTLARTLSPSSRSCHYHKGMLHDLVEMSKTKKSKEKPSGPVAMAVFDDDVLKTTALLPMCTDCESGCGVLVNTVNGPWIVNEVDDCTCALAILGLDCAFCEIGRIEAAKELELQKRTDPEGQGRLMCGCGRALTGQDSVRKCAGCGGIKTGLFGNALFVQETESQGKGSLPQVVAAAIEASATPPQRCAAPVDQPAPRKRKRAAPVGQAARKRKTVRVDETDQVVAVEAVAGPLFDHDTSTLFDDSLSGYLSVVPNGGDFWSPPGFPTISSYFDTNSSTAAVDMAAGDIAAAARGGTANADSSDDILRQCLTEFMGL